MAGSAANSERGAIEFRVLGPVEAVRDGHQVALGGPRQRVLLALLLVERGRPVSADRLVDALWPTEPPAGAPATVRAYVSKLRSSLGSKAPITISPAGYALAVPDDAVDAIRFERLATEGRAALDRGATRVAAERLRAALGLWRGEPFAGLADEATLRREADRLEEIRRSALEERIEVDLAFGRATQLVDELESLVVLHPYRERLWRQLMLALYRSERQTDALATYQRARRLLADELGIEPGEELQALERSILRHDVPAAPTVEQRHNLPAPISSFIGRGAELADIDRLLDEVRLLVLTGVGGVGKTRLALEAAVRALPTSPDGVFLVDLAALTEPTLVARQAAAALGIREPPDEPLDTHLATRLRDAELLLVLDNCEHLRVACTDLASALLAACPGVRVLATSRETLGVPGEVDYPVQPLALPGPDADTTELQSSEAVRLFLTRAGEARPRRTDDPGSLATAARICQDLDGLPLAIELAAARTKAQSLDEIATRLNDRFQFLVSWRRLSPARHRTLRAAMDWSHDLLSDDERALLDRLSVFAGGFSVETAATICLDGDEARAVDLIGRLVDASLVVTEERAGRMRYRLLETVRQYAAEQLEARGGTSALRHRHGDAFAALADEAWGGLRDAEGTASWMERLGADTDNFRAAMAWARDADEPRHLLRLTGGLWWFWWLRGDFGEGRTWLGIALEHGGSADPDLRALAMEGAAGLAWAQGDLASATDLAGAAQRLFAAAGDRRGEATCTNILGLVANARQDYRAAESMFERTIVLAEASASEGWSKQRISHAHNNLGQLALDEGNAARAAHQYGAALALYREEADREGIALAEFNLGLVGVEDSRYDDAAELLGGALTHFREVGFLYYAAECFEGIAAIAQARGRSADAATLLGASEALRERTGNPPAGMLARLREREIESTRGALGPNEFAAAWAAGRAMREADMLDRGDLAVRT